MSDEVVLRYEWSGLRNRRILLVVAVLLVFPISCVAASIADSPVPFPLSLLTLGAALSILRAWRCPRCGRGFSARAGFPWVAPLNSECEACGLPDFTPSSDLAPAVVEPVPVADATSQPALTPEALDRKRRQRRRMRVGLALAIPLLYLSMCRLPDGRIVRTSAGHAVRFLGLTRNWYWTYGGKTTSLVFTYYASMSPDSASDGELLALTIPAVRETGDSVVRLERIRGDWWARALGIRISYLRAFRLSPDGNWHGGGYVTQH